LLIAAALVLTIGYKTAPKAHACNTVNSVNSVNARTSQPPRCLARPATGYLVTAGFLAAIGLLVCAPWWLRRLGSRPPGA
jgi:hypothetical protein